MVGQWFKSIFATSAIAQPEAVLAESAVLRPEGLEAMELPDVDLNHLELASASDFLNQLTLDGLTGLRFGNLRRPPLAVQKSFKAGMLSYSEKGLLIVMRKDCNRFDITFADLWTKLKAIGVKDAKKMFVDNQILWSWRWEFDEVVCKLSYWNRMAGNKDEGVKFSCHLKSA